VLNYRYQDRQFQTAPSGPAVPKGLGITRRAIRGTGRTSDLKVNLASSKSARISLWGHNITNQRYLTGVIGQGPIIPLPGVVPGTTVGPGYTYQSIAWASPPTYGVDFIYNFLMLALILLGGWLLPQGHGSPAGGRMTAPHPHGDESHVSRALAAQSPKPLRMWHSAPIQLHFCLLHLVEEADSMGAA